MLKGSVKIAAVILILFYLPVNGYSQLWKKLTKKERPTFFEMQKAANEYYERYKEGRKPGFKQFKRWEWFARTRLDKDGYFDPTLNWKGWEEKQKRFGSGPDTSGSNWTPLGPLTLPIAANSYPGMGRLNCIAFDPRDTDIIWVGAPTGGLWKSMDGGQTWTTTTDHLPNLGVSDILIHPQNPDIIYIATGDKQRGSTLSFGVMKSLDGGQTWQFTGLNPHVTEKCKIGQMLMHPDDPETILLAANKGIYKTTDGGDTWIKKASGDFFDIEVNAAHSSTWYASRAGTGVYRSIDSGENWTRLTNGLPVPSNRIGRIAIAVCTSSPQILYAVYCQDVESQGWEWGLYGVYRSIDGGSTWTLQANSPNLLGWATNGLDTGGQGGYALILDVKPTDPNVVYVGAVNIWKSMDGGITWQIISNTSTIWVHVDHHDFAFLPGSSTTIFSCNDGGLHKSNDGGKTWTDLSSGLVIQQVYRLGLSPQDPHQVVVGTQDNGSEILNGEWRAVYGGDGTECIIDPINNSIIYCSWQFGNFLRSDNGGGSFGRIFEYEGGEYYAWVAPLVMDPYDSATLYTASNRVYKSTNRGNNRTPISAELSGEPMTVLAVAPSNPNCIFATDGRRLFKTINGGSNWTELNTGAFFFPTFMTDIAIHPQDQKILWVTFGGYGRWNSKFTWDNIPYEIDKAKVYLSKDGGNTWSDVSGLLPNIPANCIVIDPYSLNVYIGTDLGVFYSETGLGDWKRFDNGLPNVIVTEMEIHKAAGKIVATTYGRGLWESPLAASHETPALYPPLHFSARTERNDSLLQTEYINILSWAANPINSNNNMGISFYRIYQVSGNTPTLLAELDASTFEYVHRKLEKKTYQYALAAVNENGQESDALYLTVRIEGG
jgi:photosystem II stability/assembly factor-like uncharacterized protein